ncbi:MAG: dihydrolipoamide succinyltransferase [Gallionellales bacterium 35-53-114]|jgi:2-oxoglutarate dehydrogenase E2 component (dihydrolipoamide succinyltransferase)|nr:MAG: dihydrolipoamide succinyltransferase [Gallionellales bacterium 35-53-114]OYZ62189.1 MAG: dihydrolipoamide succinyltransferase [Gallionellales bacterium 24-53-125]OZB07248.1 MAG: dihydrolipoamide succinyltransferase [Gallionellales bacterium 39-52-133]HQS59794.1 2-oxoglutarate dehydrogenase complex dihydrolipoyllysine-residue succinyltransferase [Gallionellaceae bacterium]HQS76548.1 2-oxoglutarate dehydrogenase complex dihydrolipoyllysine-residue succinyltransferase [Gallionellaceae bact
MKIEVKVPQLSESVSEASLLSWNKKVGEAVTEGESLIDIETDKVVLELPAIKSGVLTKILKQNGEKVSSGEVIAMLDTEAKASAESAPAPAAAAKAAPAAAAVMPAAKKIATEKNIDTAEISGSGRGGRVIKEDVLNVQEKSAALVASIPQPQAGGRIEQRVPMTRIRQRIAERLLQSQQNAAILTTFNEVNMQPVIELRNRYKDAFEKKHGVKLGFTSFFVKAVVMALQKFPIVNASVDGTDIVYHGYFDIGVAIGSERGLVVPIIRDADKLSLADIEKQIADFAARAKDGKLTMEELTGGTFSITNGGVFGSMLSTPIINPPQSAILGIHATKDRPVAENGQVVIRPMNYLAVSYDHRIIDGREAVQFLVTIKEALEYPGRVLLDL